MKIQVESEREKKLFSVGLIADTQFADSDRDGNRHYRNSIKKLGNAVTLINEAGVDFSIQLGDLIDRDFENFDAILEPLNGLTKPIIHIAGNHDFAVTDDKKNEVFDKLRISEPYHSFSKQGFRFVFLDGTEISTFANAPNSCNFAFAENLLEDLKSRGKINAQPWNGGIGAAQLAWFNSELNQAKVAGEKVVVSCHYPIFPDHSHNLLNDREVVHLIDLFQGTVAAWFGGHNHAGNYLERNGVHHVTLQGMVDTENSNAFAVLDVSPHCLVIRGSGRVPSQVMTLDF